MNGIFLIISLYSPIILALGLTFLSTSFMKITNLYPNYNFICFKNLEFILTGKINGMKKHGKDSLRKTNHVLMFLGLIFIWITSLIVVLNITGSSIGMIPSENNMILIFIEIIFNIKNFSAIIMTLGWFYYLLFIFFYSFFMIMIANEFTRKSHRYVLAFNYFLKFALNEEELKGYGSYLYFAIGHLFASLFCPPMIFFAILSISCIVDLIASQVGIRFGKKPIKWNSLKTWEGNIVATISCFFITLFFVGVIWGIIFSISFSFFDIITGKGFREKNISDNLLIPLGCSLIYLVIRFAFDLDYFPILLCFF